MEELGSLWTYQPEAEENIEDLKQRLLYRTLELESFKLEANQEIVRMDEGIRNLIGLLKAACKERDEARHQLHNAQQKVAAASSPTQLPYTQQESFLLLKANSSVTESSSFSEPYNHHSYGSSPVDSFLDTSSPEFSNINVVDSNTVGFVKQKRLATPENCFVSRPLVSSVNTSTDPADAVLENLSKGKPLPRKGKLLQAVVESGTTLQTLLLAGPLPRWRNPPPVQSSFTIPPINLQTCKTSVVDQSSVSNKSSSTSTGINFQTSRPSSLNFNNGASRNLLLSSASNSVSLNSQVSLAKRQRLN